MPDIVAADTVTLHCRCARCEATGTLAAEGGTCCPTCEGRGAWDAPVTLGALVEWVAEQLDLDPPLPQTRMERERGLTRAVLLARERRLAENANA